MAFRLLILSIFFILSQQSSQAQSLIYVVDSLSKVPVESALVQVLATGEKKITDENGAVRLNLSSGGSSTILISCIGFRTQSVSLNPEDLSGVNHVIFLQQKIASLSEVTVKAASRTGIFKTISDFDIHLRPISNSQEVLRMVPGLFIGQHAGGGKAEQIFLRGFDLDHGTDINISVDGMPVNMVSHAHGQGYADLHFVIPEMIQKVDFNKGPYFADKGNFTTAGYVAFKTRDYLEKNFVKVEGGQFSTFRTIAGVNLLKNKNVKRDQNLFFAGEFSHTQGYFESPQDFNRYNGLLKYHGNLSSKNVLTATLSAFTSKWNASGQIPDRAVDAGIVGFYGAIDNTEGGQTSRYNANLELLTYLPRGATLKNQLFYSKYDFELYSNFTFFKENPIDGDQIRQKEDRNIFGYNSSYNLPVNIGKKEAELSAGVQLRYDNIDDIELTRTKQRTINTERIKLGDVDETNLGAYAALKVSMSPKLDITGAVRGDYFHNAYNDKLIDQKFSSNSTILSPKLNFNFKVNDQVQLYFYNGRGFHSNDTRVAVAQDGRKVLPPAYGSDIGGIFKIGKKLVLQSALWYLWLDQEFVYVGDEGVVEPGGQTRRLGVDLSARYEPVKNLYADMDLSFANPRALHVPSEEHFLPLAPVFSSVGGISYKKQYGLNGSLRYRLMADRPANETNDVVAKGYCILDAALNYTKKNWEAGLTIQNVLNTKWKETQFDTESRLKNEPEAVSEIHFTPGTPFQARASFTLFF